VRDVASAGGSRERGACLGVEFIAAGLATGGYHRPAMAEQLNLRFEPALPRPGDVAPMWPTPSPEPFDSDDHLFEPTWGGHRVLAFVDPSERPGGGAVRIVDPTGRDLVDRLPELSGLAVRVAARSAVLDGELVVVDASGRADDDALRERLNGNPGRPVAYLVFDILHLDGLWLLNVPLEKRRLTLRRVLRPGDEVVVVPAIAGEGRALHAAVTAQGIAGVLARQRTSPYLPGVHSVLWRSIVAGPTGDAAAVESGSTDALDAPAIAAGTAPVLALFRRLPFDEDPLA
jgi:bifunctional non-homologous end joining protein LigD